MGFVAMGLVSMGMGGCGADVTTEGAASTSSARPPSSPAMGQLAISPPEDHRALAQVLANIPTPPSPGDKTVSAIASGSATTSAAADRTKPNGVSLVQMQPDLKASNAGTEKDLRATLYFDLVDQCRDEDGQILPAEAVEIEFRVDPSGAIDRSSVRASSERPEYEPAARCMVRVIRTADARFAPVRLDEPTRVWAFVPSVD